MLHIRIDGQDVEMTPALLAKLVFDGKVDQHSVTRLPGGTAEQPLEQALGSPQGEALTAELHRRLGLMCSMDATAVDAQELCARVEGLCHWRWGNLPVAARFFWAAGWLNELADRAKKAVEFYDAFLLMPSGESHLRLLALNNRGVLRIQLGRLEGVQDLARAAISDFGFRISDCGLGVRDQGSGISRLNPAAQSLPSGANPPSAIRHPPSGGLPAACFNLLNLINVSFSAADLLRAVEEELADYFSRLPEDLGALWLGPPSLPDDPNSRAEPSHPSPGDTCQAPLILRDPTYRRLNTLVARLSAQARGLVPDSRHPLGHASSVFRQLSLWDCRLHGDCPGPEEAGRLGDHFVPDQHDRYAEAASLLLSDDIPSALTRPENPLARMEQSAREELAVTEGYLTSGQYELAKSRLHVQRNVLLSLSARGGLAAVLARVEEQLEKIGALEAQEKQLQFQQACARFVSEVQEFCTLTDVCQAQSRLTDLQRRLQQFQAQAPARTGTEGVDLLDDLGTRLQRHLDGLKRVQIETLVDGPRRYVRQNRPSERTDPVPESVYRALAQCRLHDPQGWIEDWPALEEQLDAHQGQYYAHRALSALQSSPGSWDEVRDDLAEALRYDPSSWRTVSSLFGWGTGKGGDSGFRVADFGLRIRGQGSDTRDEGSEVGRLSPASPPLPSGVNPQSAVRNPQLDGQPPFTADQAGLLLGKVLRQLGADVQRCLRLWQCVAGTLAPALAGGDAEALAQARLLAEKCLEFWPAGSPEVPGRADPRHPVNRFLEACEKARCLVEAEQLLEARPPRLEEAKRHLAGILRSGVDTRDQLRRMVTGFYLAQCREKDSPSVQRQVLADLEAWVDAVPQEAVLQMRGREIVEETEKVRVAVAERSESGPCQARPDEPAANERGRGLLAKSWGGRKPRPKQDETGNARKEA
jgi:tetratricopeptide (TPR) repeat protein